MWGMLWGKQAAAQPAPRPCVPLKYNEYTPEERARMEGMLLKTALPRLHDTSLSFEIVSYRNQSWSLPLVVTFFVIVVVEDIFPPAKFSHYTVGIIVIVYTIRHERISQIHKFEDVSCTRAEWRWLGRELRQSTNSVLVEGGVIGVTIMFPIVQVVR